MITTRTTSLGPGRRLAKPQRREQLLDVAAEVLVDFGPAAITMERVAEEAGVSKAIPYRHFDNATELLRALHEREITHLGTRISQAVTAASGPEAKLRAAIGVYFDVIAERGVLLGVLGREIPPGSGAATIDGTGFVADLLSDTYDIGGKRARILAEMILGALLGAVTVWGRGDAVRARVQATATDAVLAMVAGVRGAS